MEKSATQEDTVVQIVENGELRSPEGRSVRRRLTQSTLFSQKSPDMEKGGVEDELNDNDDDGCDGGDGEDDEYRGSQNKKKGKQKRKATPGSKKKSVEKQGKVKEGSSGRLNKKDSPASAKSNFFVRVSDRRPQNKPEKELQCCDSPEGNSKMSSPSESLANLKSAQNPKPKRQVTPRKKLAAGSPKASCAGELLTSPMPTEHGSQTIPDLRLEAKMTAEENSRLFAGKQMHPFFSSMKSSKKYSETIDVDNDSCSVERNHKNISFGPIHVFETLQHDVFPLDWTKWTLCEKVSSNSRRAQQSASSSVFEGSVESLNIDKLLKVSQLQSESCVETKPYLEQFPGKTHYSHALAGSTLLNDVEVGCCQQMNETKMDCEVDKFGIFPGQEGYLENLDDSQEDRISQERKTADYLCSSDLPLNILWTEKYQPEKSIEVCGNSDSVKYLSEWLHVWHEREFQGIRGSKDSATVTQNINSDGYNDSDCDSESSDEAATLKNVLLVTGPVGSGKSAAIYACAKEQGFKVIEVNTSHWRNGALVKQKFREAVESHRLKWSLKNHVGSQSQCSIDLDPALPKSDEAQDFDSEVIELIPLSDEEESRDAIRTYGKENRAASGQDGIKSLVLFEDVDITFLEDRGLINAIQQLAETAKLPMILTTNSTSPVLPESFDRLDLCFAMPSPEELLGRVHKVCAAEKASINGHLREKLIKCFDGDIRKTIMHLQFWCQGNRDTQDSKVQRTYAPLQFDILAGHNILPNIIPWNFPSLLSELIEKEIGKSLSNIEENHTSANAVGEELVGEEMQDRLHTSKDERDIDAKKEAMLSNNSSCHDYSEYQAPTENVAVGPESPPESSDPPIAFTRRNNRKKLDRVLSFSSEDEDYDGRLHDNSVNETNNEVNFNFDCSTPSPSAGQTCLNLIANRLLQCDFPLSSQVSQNGACSIPFPWAGETCFNHVADQLLECDFTQTSPATQNVGCSVPFSPAGETCLNQIGGQLLRCVYPQIPPETQNGNCSIPFPPADETCLNSIADHMLQRDFPQISPAQNGLDPLTDQIFYSNNEKDTVQDSHPHCLNRVEESFVSYTCGSQDMSRIPESVFVPESSFVPETEMDNGVEILSRDFSLCRDALDNTEAASMETDLMLSMSPVRDDKPLSRLRRCSETMRYSFTNAEPTHSEELGDSQYMFVESPSRRYQVMDECSRMDFNKKIHSPEKPRPHVIDSVQETWNNFRARRADFRELVAMEQKNASLILKRAFDISSLISDADLLLSNANSSTSDSLEQSVIHFEESDASGWYSQQLQMTSTLTEHGFCFYTNDITATESSISSNSKVDLVSEILSYTNDSMALGKLIRQEMTASVLPHIGCSVTRQSLPGDSLPRTTAPCFRDVIHSLVPSKSRMSLKGEAFNEYLSSLGRISRSEAYRLTPGSTITRRTRGRAARHYLSNGALGLSPEDISLLNQYNGYGKPEPQPAKASLKNEASADKLV